MLTFAPARHPETRAPAPDPARRGPRIGRWSVLGLAALLSACATTDYRADPVDPVLAPSQPLYFYPQHQQPLAQQERDRYECYRWAMQQTGSDPGLTPIHARRAGVADPYAGRDTALGAVTGAAIGSLAASPRHTGEGAAVGLIIGALIGAASDQQRAQALQDNYRHRPPPASASSRFQRAMSACMSGRGYVVG